MGFFDDDPFEEIIKEFFGSPYKVQRRRDQFIQGENEDRNIDLIEGKNEVYLIFDLPGYSKEDIIVSVKGKMLEIVAKNSGKEKMQKYLNKKLKEGTSISKKLPDFVNPNKFSYTMKNGILEIVFQKSKQK